MYRRRPLHDESVVDGSEDGSEENEVCISDPPQVPTKVCEHKEGPENPLSWLAIPWHLAMMVFYSLLLKHGIQLINANLHILDPESKVPRYGGRLKFLTHINEWVQLAFFTIQLLADLSPGPFKKRLQRLSDILFTTIAFPLATFVTISFWGLYALGRELVYPEVWDKAIPSYMNHFWHTTILLWVLCEIYLFHHHFPSTAWAAATIFVYSTVYISWVVYLFVKTEWWCYPFMEHLPLFVMALFFAACMFISLGLYLLGKALSRMRWGMVTLLEGF